MIANWPRQLAPKFEFSGLSSGQTGSGQGLKFVRRIHLGYHNLCLQYEQKRMPIGPARWHRAEVWTSEDRHTRTHTYIWWQSEYNSTFFLIMRKWAKNWNKFETLLCAEKKISLVKSFFLGNLTLLICLVCHQEGHPTSKTNHSNTPIELQHSWQ